MHPYLKINYDFLGLESLLDNLGFLRGSQTLTSRETTANENVTCPVDEEAVLSSTNALAL